MFSLPFVHTCFPPLFPLFFPSSLSPALSLPLSLSRVDPHVEILVINEGKQLRGRGASIRREKKISVIPIPSTDDTILVTRCTERLPHKLSLGNM